MNINLEKFFPDNFKMTYMHENENLIYIKIKSISKENICPCCGKKSNKVHSTYERNIKDLPIINKKLYITIISKKFFCTNADCERKIFSERFKDFVERYSRRSNRLNLAIEKIFLTNNAETASKIIKSIITYISPSTILRFKGSYSTIKLTVKKIKNLCECKGKNKNSIKKISKQNLIKLLCQYYDNLSKNQKKLLKEILDNSEELRELKSLIESFYLIFKEKDLKKFYLWINNSKASSFSKIHNFTNGLIKDINAVSDAIKYSFSNAVLEGNISRLKMIKRQMYGRANFDLIKQKVLYNIDG